MKDAEKWKNKLNRERDKEEALKLKQLEEDGKRRRRKIEIKED